MSLTMTPRQRLLTALTCREPDRVPITLHGVYPYHVGEDWRCAHPSYRPLLDLAREQTDPLCSWSPDAGTFYADLRVEERRLDDGDFVETIVSTPRGPISQVRNTIQQIKKTYIEGDEDIQRFLSIGYAPVRPDLAPAWELERAVGERGLLYVGYLDPLGIVADLFTPEEFAIRCYYEMATIKKMIEKVFEHQFDYVRYLVVNGPRSLWNLGGPEYATAPLLAPRYFDEFVVPFDGPLIDLIHQHGSLAQIHCHGRLDGVLERIAGMGPDALHPIEAPPMGDVTLAEAKRRVGSRVCLIGNVQIGDLIALPRADIDRSVRDALCDGAPGGGFILSTTASPYEAILGARTLENYTQLVETGRACGLYAPDSAASSAA